MKSHLVPLRVFLILLTLLIIPLNTSAQSGIHTPQATDRYVSPTGMDSGGCTNPTNPCQTINYARSQSASGDTIHLAEGEYIENVVLFIAVNLEGAGAETTIINGNASGNVVYAYNNPTPVTISHLTLRNGSAQYGGGLYTFTELTLDDVIIEDNHASIYAGGIYNDGTLTMLNSIVRNNTAATLAAGIFSNKTATIHNGAIIGNRVADTGAYGGGIHNNSEAYLELANVTISGNQAPSSAGLSSSGIADLINVTIAGNIGQGIGNFAAGSVVNTIIANNTVTNCYLPLPTLGNNLDSGAACGFSGPGDLQDTPAKLDVLSNYNSPIPTYNLQPGSPAIDSANEMYCPSIDARGVTRPIDGDGVGGAVCDRGAHEYDPVTEIPRIFLPVVLRN